MSIVPEVSITEFKKFKVHELKELKCCEVLSDGEYLFSFVNPATDYIRQQVQNLGQLSNAVKGKDLAEITEQREITGE